MKRKQAWILMSVLLALSALGIIYLLFVQNEDRDRSGGETVIDLTPSSEPTATPTPSPTSPPTPEPPVFSEAVWIGVGDIMSHTPQLPGAYDKTTQTYDFTPYFADVKPILQQGDWVMANLETPIAGADFGYSGYPMFNAPFELAEALLDAGFNLLSTANNHSLDKGEKGLLRTLDHLQQLGLQAIGTAASQEDAETPIISEQNGIKMGLLAYTYGTNGIPIPQGKPYLVQLIDEQKIVEDMRRLREAGADLVTVALHFGNEYQTQPSQEQLRLARALTAAGADIIAGSHPHVIQPYEVVETFDEHGNEKQALIIYSMGNFISNQRGDSKDYGVIFKVGVRKNMTEGTIELTEIEAIPTWVHRYKPDHAFRYRILPVEQTIDDATDDMLKPSDYETLRKDLEMLQKRLDSLK